MPLKSLNVSKLSLSALFGVSCRSGLSDSFCPFLPVLPLREDLSVNTFRHFSSLFVKTGRSCQKLSFPQRYLMTFTDLKPALTTGYQRASLMLVLTRSVPEVSREVSLGAVLDSLRGVPGGVFMTVLDSLRGVPGGVFKDSSYSLRGVPGRCLLTVIPPPLMSVKAPRGASFTVKPVNNSTITDTWRVHHVQYQAISTCRYSVCLRCHLQTVLTTWHIQPLRALRTMWYIQPLRHLGTPPTMWHKQPPWHIPVYINVA